MLLMISGCCLKIEPNSYESCMMLVENKIFIFYLRTIFLHRRDMDIPLWNFMRNIISKHRKNFKKFLEFSSWILWRYKFFPKYIEFAFEYTFHYYLKNKSESEKKSDCRNWFVFIRNLFKQLNWTKFRIIWNIMRWQQNLVLFFEEKKRC